MRHLSLAGSQLPGIMGRTSSEDTEATSYMHKVGAEGLTQSERGGPTLAS